MECFPKFASIRFCKYPVSTLHCRTVKVKSCFFVKKKAANDLRGRVTNESGGTALQAHRRQPFRTVSCLKVPVVLS